MLSETTFELCKTKAHGKRNLGLKAVLPHSKQRVCPTMATSIQRTVRLLPPGLSSFEPVFHPNPKCRILSRPSQSVLASHPFSWSPGNCVENIMTRVEWRRRLKKLLAEYDISKD